jgi:hypothetical protein
MAARLDIFAVAEGTHLETWEREALDAASADRSELPDLEGFVSASDEDEEALFELLGDIAEHTVVDARAQGTGTVPGSRLPELGSHLRGLAAKAKGPAGSWLPSLADSVGKVEQRGAALGWRMQYDLGGSTDAGPEEYPTAWS